MRRRTKIVLGASAMLGTPLLVLVVAASGPGTRWIARKGINALNARLDGSVSVASVDGSVLGKLSLSDVVIRDPLGRTVASVERIEAQYNPLDIVRGQYVVKPLLLENPRLWLVQHPSSDTFTLVDVIPATGSSTDGGRQAHFMVEAVVRGGMIVMDLPDETRTRVADILGAHTSSELRESGPMHITGIHASIRASRLLERDSDMPLRIDVDSLGFMTKRPAVTVRQLHSRVTIAGDTVRVDSFQLVLQQSELHASGWIARDSSTQRTALDIDLTIPRIGTTDFISLDTGLSQDLVLAGSLTARVEGEGPLRLQSSVLTLKSTSDSGRLDVAGTVTFHAQSGFRIDEPITLTADRFALRTILRYETSLDPWRLHGTLEATGSDDELQTVLDASLVNENGHEFAAAQGQGNLIVSDLRNIAYHNVELRALRADIGEAERAGLPVRGDGTVEIRGSFDGDLSRLSFTGDILHRTQEYDPTIASGTLDLEYGSAPLAVIAQFALDSLHLDGISSAFWTQRLTGALAGEVASRGTLDSLSVDVQLAGPGGQLSITGVIQQRDDSVTLHRSTLTLGDFDVSHFLSNAVNTRLNATAQTEGLLVGRQSTNGALALSIEESSIAEISIDSGIGQLFFDGSSADLDSLMVRGPGLSIVGQGSFATRPHRDGSLAVSVQIDSLGIVDPLLSGVDEDSVPTTTLSGAMQLDMDIRADDNDWNADVSIAAPAVQWNETIRAANVRVDGQWSLQNGVSTSDVVIDSLRLGRTSVRDFRAHVAGIDDEWNWNADATIREAGTTAAGGRLHTDSMGYIATLDSFDLALWTSSWSLDSSTTAVLHPGQQQISDFVFRDRTSDGRIAGGGTLASADSGNMRIEIQQFPIADVIRAISGEPHGFSGTLDATLAIDGAASDRRYDLTAGLGNVVLDTLVLPTAQFDIEYSDGAAHGDVTLTHLGREILRGTGRMPVAMAAPGTSEPPDSTLAVSLTLDSVPASTLNALVPAAQGLTGSVDGFVEIAGTPNEPVLGGTFTFDEGEFSLPRLRTRYDDVRASVRFAADTVYIDSVGLVDADGNPARAAGFVHLPNLQNPVVDVEIALSDFLAINDEDYTNLHLTGGARLTGPILSPSISGDVTVDGAVVQVRDVLEKDVIDLEDPLFGAFVDTTVLQEEQLANPFAQRLVDSLHIDDLRLVVGTDVWVRSTDANVQMSGEVIVNKMGNRYPLSGTLNTVRGIYAMRLGPGITREFTVTRGEVRFFGTDSTNAVLDIDAEHTLRTVRGDELTVFANIGGTMIQPNVTLSSSSTTTLPETELISYLMFGAPSIQVFAGNRGREQRTVFQRGAAQFTELLAGRLEQSLSGVVDYFSIAPGDPSEGFSNTGIFVGKQLDLFGRSSFITVSPRLCPTEPLSGFRNIGLTVETWLATHWLFDASLDPRKGCQNETSPNATPYQFGVDFLWVKR